MPHFNPNSIQSFKHGTRGERFKRISIKSGKGIVNVRNSSQCGRCYHVKSSFDLKQIFSFEWCSCHPECSTQMQLRNETHYILNILSLKIIIILICASFNLLLFRNMAILIGIKKSRAYNLAVKHFLFSICQNKKSIVHSAIMSRLSKRWFTPKKFRRI